ncbi:MAG: FtsX-like permease family protein, partial [Bacteroidota bacterium]
EPYALALTKTAAEKLFDTVDALNKIVINGDGDNFTIRAILADLPKQSHIVAESFCSFKTLEEKRKGSKWFRSWGNMWSNHVYVLLEESANIESFQQQLDALSKRENESSDESIQLGMLPLTGIVPGPEMSNMSGPSFDIDIIWVLVALAAIILLSACFNYTNLSIARSLRRSKEVGVRKTVGATGGHVFAQFVIEAVLVSLVALVGAYPLFYLARPLLVESLSTSYDILELALTPAIITAFLIYAVLTGVLAGLFPSWVMARMKVKSILRDMSSVKLFSNVSMRKALVVFQFALSMVFIISAFIGYNQFQYMLNFDLGFKTDNVLNVSIQNNDYQVLENEFRKLPQVEDVSFSLMIPSIGSRYVEQVKDPLSNDSLEIVYNRVHPNYLRLHEHQLVAGSSFDESYINAKDKKAIVVNESFLKEFDIVSADDAIGREFVLRNNPSGRVKIIGVVEDFHFGTTQEGLGPYLFVNGAGNGLEKWPDYYEMNIKLNTSDMTGTMALLEEAWSNVDEVHQFKAEFYSEAIAEAYDFFKSIVNIIGALAVIAISIAALGLLGMVVFTTETRLKEISIRKILGATEGNLLILLGRNFLVLLAVAALVAIPLTYFVFD